MPIREFKCSCGKVTDEIISTSAPIPPKVLCEGCGNWAEYNPITKPAYRRDHSIKGNPEDGAIWDGKDYIKEEYV